MWNPRGVGTALRASWKCPGAGAGPPLVLETRGLEPRARRLSLAELWQQTGLTRQDLPSFERRRAKGAGRTMKDDGPEAVVAAGRATERT